MRRPHFSTGAWLFCGIVTAALIGPAGVYAAVNSHVAIGNDGRSPTTAIVDPEHQLLTTMVDPRSIIRVYDASVVHGCNTLYTPPSGKALVLTNVTFTFFSGTQTSAQAQLRSRNCKSIYDGAVTMKPYASEQHTYPAGLPVDSVTVDQATQTLIYADGYLIPASQMPPHIFSVGTTPRVSHR